MARERLLPGAEHAVLCVVWISTADFVCCETVSAQLDDAAERLAITRAGRSLAEQADALQASSVQQLRQPGLPLLGLRRG